jgi:hypothetical protein
MVLKKQIEKQINKMELDIVRYTTDRSHKPRYIIMNSNFLNNLRIFREDDILMGSKNYSAFFKYLNINIAIDDSLEDGDIRIY